VRRRGISRLLTVSHFLALVCFLPAGAPLMCMPLVLHSCDRAFLSHRHKHHHFMNLRLSLKKTGTSTTDVMTVRLISFFTQMSANDKRGLGQMG